jgi:hypothetical protein
MHIECKESRLYGKVRQSVQHLDSQQNLMMVRIYLHHKIRMLLHTFGMVALVAGLHLFGPSLKPRVRYCNLGPSM